jgi:mannose-6-phosphate isomerase
VGATPAFWHGSCDTVRLASLTSMPDPRAEAIARFAAHPHPLRLQPVIQPYAWGGHEFLADLVGLPSAPGQPRAELWAGAHPGGPATVHLGDDIHMRLDELVERAAPAVLGRASLARFGPHLPYLLKVLDVRAMLSIQAHPTLEQAAEGFAREDAAGVPRSAPHRNYRDANHKPEAQVALTEFWLLYGFRPLREIRRLLGERPELAPLLSALPAGTESPEADAPAALRRLYTHMMTMPQPEIDALLDPLLQRLAGHVHPASPSSSSSSADPAPAGFSPDFWAARAASEFALPGGARDRGILSIYLLNLVRLAPGQATFIGPGVLHAYLSGVAVEIMASSDNVLRGGLTPKHVDVPELLRILRFDPTVPQVVDGEVVSAVEREFRGPAEEFVLARLDLGPGREVCRRSTSAEVLLVVEGDLAVAGAGGSLALGRGQLALVPADVEATLTAAAHGATVFRAAVPLPRP